jgi:hypothetical protein
MLLLFVLPLALGYWYFTLRAYALAARSNSDWQRVLSPVMLGPLASSFCYLPAQPLQEGREGAEVGATGPNRPPHGGRALTAEGFSPSATGPGADLAPFGRWLTPHLVLRGLTVAQLARQLGHPKAAILAVMYGVPVGSRLPSVTLVDAICAHLRLDQDEGRAAFLAIVSDSQPGSRSV